MWIHLVTCGHGQMESRLRSRDCACVHRNTPRWIIYRPEALASFLLKNHTMTDPEEILVSGSNFDEFSRSLTSAIKALPAELSKKLRSIRSDYFGWHGFDGAYLRLNNKTVRQIFESYQPESVAPLASGEVDGVRYTLFEASQHDRTDETDENVADNE
jgi:hypothetical protein